MSRIRTFVDANILIAAFRGNQDISDEALRVLGDPNREFVASPFLRLELVPKPAYEKRRIELEFYEIFFAEAEMVAASGDLVVQAEHEAQTAGLSAVDALHVAAAKEAAVDEFVTGEKETKPLFRVRELKLISALDSAGPK